jgi:hypothetical protein
VPKSFHVNLFWYDPQGNTVATSGGGITGRIPAFVFLEFRRGFVTGFLLRFLLSFCSSS